MAKLELEIKEKERQQSVVDITKGVKSAYYRLLLTKKMGLVAGEAVETLSSHENDAKMFYERIIRRNDFLRAQVALSNAVQFRERAMADSGIAAADLNRWISSDINSDTRIEDIEAVKCEKFNLEEMIDKGLKARPQLQAMSIASEALNQAVTLEKSTWYPEVSRCGAYWQKGDSPVADNNDFENSYNASVMLQAKWTLFDWNRTGAKVNRAESDKRAFLMKKLGKLKTW